MPLMRRTPAAALLAAAVLALSIAAVPLLPAAAGSPGDRLPDLAMAHPRDLRVQHSGNAILLRFTTQIANLGAGAFELRGSRPDTAEPGMAVVQRIYDGAGEHRDRDTAARMFWSGDGHTHWHVGNLLSSRIDRLPEPSQSPLRTGAKQGFCFYDTDAFRLSLPGAPSSAVYRTCGTSPSQLTTTMGLSVGWSDVYPWGIAYQWIDVTGLPSGRYRLTVAADPSGWFEEADALDNTSWVDIDLRMRRNGGSVKVVARGPGA